jgi:hypothetical protein
MDIRNKHRCSTPECQQKGWCKWATAALWNKQTGRMRRVCDKCAEALLSTQEWTTSRVTKSNSKSVGVQNR